MNIVLIWGLVPMTAPQSSGTEAIRADIRQDATHPKKDPMRRMGSRAKIKRMSRFSDKQVSHADRKKSTIDQARTFPIPDAIPNQGRRHKHRYEQ
jgi:hypothetical protein